MNNENKHWKKSNLDPLWTPFAPHFFIIDPILVKFSHNNYVKSEKKHFLFMKNFPFRA